MRGQTNANISSFPDMHTNAISVPNIFPGKCDQLFCDQCRPIAALSYNLHKTTVKITVNV